MVLAGVKAGVGARVGAAVLDLLVVVEYVQMVG